MSAIAERKKKKKKKVAAYVCHRPECNASAKNAVNRRAVPCCVRALTICNHVQEKEKY